LFSQERDDGAARLLPGVQAFLGEDNSAANSLNGVENLADVPHAAPGQPIERRDDQGLDLAVNDGLHSAVKLRESDVFAAADTVVIEVAARFDLETVQQGRLPIDAAMYLWAF
jgi:hypothetical protein